MKKLLAAVLAVALVAVGVVVGTRLAPVAAPQDDVVVPVADVTEPAPVDEAPAEDVKTAVLGANTEPAAVAADPAPAAEGQTETETETETETGTETGGGTGDDTDAGNTNDRNDALQAESEIRWHHDTTPDDGISIDAINGVDNDTVWIYAENSAGNVTFDSFDAE